MTNENNNNNSSVNFLTGVVLGSLVGAATALLLAPKSGRELRTDINTQVENFKEKSGEWTETVKEKGIELTDVAKEKTEQVKNVVVDKSSQIADTVKEKSTQLRNKAETTVEDAKLS